MYRLLEILNANDVFMSIRPDVDGDSVVFAFRKTNRMEEVYNKCYRMTNAEINGLDVNITEVVIDFAERFIKGFEAEQEKDLD